MTFSVVAMDGKSLGVGVASGSIAVGNRVPWVRKEVGAIATQGYTKTKYGRKGLELLEEGLNPRSALRELLRKDNSPERRQVAIIDSSGRKAIHTGSSCPRERNSESQENCISIGNMLKNERTVSEMIKAFERSGKLPLRILEALEAGAEAGGDRRGDRTAALVIRGEENIDIKIDESKDPLRELRKTYEER